MSLHELTSATISGRKVKKHAFNHYSDHFTENLINNSALEYIEHDVAERSNDLIEIKLNSMTQMIEKGNSIIKDIPNINASNFIPKIRP